MSKDIIYKEDAMDAIECVTWYHQNRNKDMVSGANSDEHQAWYKSQDIYEALENVPSADTFEITKEALIEAIDNAETVGDVVGNIINRPQGEWIDKGWHGDWQFETDGRGNCWKAFECSSCNTISKVQTNFCPNCGAKMKGVINGNK